MLTDDWNCAAKSAESSRFVREAEDDAMASDVEDERIKYIFCLFFVYFFSSLHTTILSLFALSNLHLLFYSPDFPFHYLYSTLFIYLLSVISVNIC